MRPVVALAIFAMVVFVGGALLAPWLYWLFHALRPDNTIPFHRFENRAFLGLGLTGIWPLVRSLNLNSWRAVGITSLTGQWHRVRAGFLLGFASLAVVAVIALAAHGRALKLDLSAGQWAGKLAGAAATAVGVAVLEELLFRGAIFGALRQACDWRVALVSSSMVYAIVHFFEKAEITGPIHWYSGLELLPKMLAGFGDLQMVIPGFFNLTLAGIMLGLAYQRTRNLYFSIGLHAGWIFWLKFYGLATNPMPGAPEWIWGTQKLIDGWLALAVLIVAAGWLPKMLSEKSCSESVQHH